MQHEHIPMPAGERISLNASFQAVALSEAGRVMSQQVSIAIMHGAPWNVVEPFLRKMWRSPSAP